MSMIGKTLGMFECTALLGKGGMGEVYKAKDQKLGRDVAIKVLPEEFAEDTDRVARFQREAKLLASLNHSNIAAIYGLEESDSTHFLVLELIEGDTLADRLKRGAIPVEESLKLALQIAEALEAAHEKGVIHRDLKPANIKVTPDGKVKVLDFGLAKAFAGEQGDMNLSNSPTLSAAATQQGIILGTAAYMSPEQARGKPVDKRTDIWAFGVVLYEMLTGQSAFQGEDVSVTLASVIKGDANLNLLPPSIHPRIREVITRCLQNDIRRRYSSIADARYEIEQALSDPSGVFVQPVTATKPRKKLRVGIPWVAAAVILSLIVAGLAVWYLKPSEPHQITRFDYHVPASQQFQNLNNPLFAISPDGRQFAYCTREGIYLRSMDGLDARHIPGTDEIPLHPFFSPDGKWLGYWSLSNSQLKKISISGGAPVTLCEAAMPKRPLWLMDDSIVYAQNEGIMRVSAKGGNPELIVDSEGAELYAPQILPDGKSVLFSNFESIAVQSLESGERKILIEGFFPQYLPTGHIIYALNGNLCAVPFDLDTLELTGGPVPLVEGIMQMGAPQYAIADSGTLLYMPAALDSTQRTMVWVDRDGEEEPLAAQPDAYFDPKISPDGTKVALTIGEARNQDVWIWDLVREIWTRLTRIERDASDPLWTPDGQRIIFAVWSDAGQSIYWKAADGTGEVEQLGSALSARILPLSWSSDGKSLVLEYVLSTTAFGNGNIGVISMEGDHAMTPLLEHEYTETNPQVSPDGRWLAYFSGETEQSQIYVRPFPDVHKGKWAISPSYGQEPRWSPDGRELFYRSTDKMMAVPVKTDPTFKAGLPKELFQDTYLRAGPGHSWDIHPDGQRFLMIKESQTIDGPTTERVRKINIVLNWFEELKERVPID